MFYNKYKLTLSKISKSTYSRFLNSNFTFGFHSFKIARLRLGANSVVVEEDSPVSEFNLQNNFKLYREKWMSRSAGIKERV